MKVHQMDAIGVVVDTSPVGNPDGTLTKAQNALPDFDGERGAIVKRPGWKKFMATAGAGKAGGGIGVPIPLGSAGLNIQNPYTDLTTTLTQLVALITESVAEGTTEELGATFSDDSFIFDFDPADDFDDQDGEDDLEDDFLIVDDSDISASTGAATYPLTYIGVPEGTEVCTRVDLSDSVLDTDAPVSDEIQLIPSDTFAGHEVGVSPISASFYTGLGAIYNGVDTDLQAQGEATLINGKIFYNAFTYTVGTDDPPIRAFDGHTDAIVARLPKNADGTPATAVWSKIAANNKIYVAALNSGVNGSAGGTIVSSVYELDPDTYELQKLGASFPTGFLANRLLWAYGRLWCGAFANSNDTTIAARVYWIRPGIDTAWTLDKTFGVDEHLVSSMVIFQGKIYATIVHWVSGGDPTSITYVRSTTGTWTASDTGAVAHDFFTDAIVWPAEDDNVASPVSAIYVIKFTATNVLIRKFNGTSWTTAATLVSSGERFFSTYMINSANTIVPILWIADSGNTALNSPDGTTFTARLTLGGGQAIVTMPLEI
jgi:hypothetical protein